MLTGIHRGTMRLRRILHGVKRRERTIQQQQDKKHAHTVPETRAAIYYTNTASHGAGISDKGSLVRFRRFPTTRTFVLMAIFNTNCLTIRSISTTGRNRRRCHSIMWRIIGLVFHTDGIYAGMPAKLLNYQSHSLYMYSRRTKSLGGLC